MSPGLLSAVPPLPGQGFGLAEPLGQWSISQNTCASFSLACAGLQGDPSHPPPRATSAPLPLVGGHAGFLGLQGVSQCRCALGWI